MKYLLIVIVLFATSCAFHEKVSSIEFEDSYVLPNQMFEKAAVGGISALVHIEGERYYALSDDRSKYGPARIYELKIAESFDKITIRSVIYLRKGGRNYPQGSIDPEGLVILPSGNFLICSEGDRKKGIAPEIMEFEPSGEYLRSVAVPDDYLLQDGQGVRNNLAFEGLTMSPDAGRIFVGVEGALIQDGPRATDQKGGWTRIFSYKVENGNFVYDRYWKYPLEKIDNPEGINQPFVNGVVELLAIDEDELWVMERGVYVTPEKNYVNSIRLFSVILDEGDWLKKTLVKDFGDFSDKVGGQLDNQEAMALVKLQTGYMLITASDNNFNASQRNLFLKFRTE